MEMAEFRRAASMLLEQFHWNPEGGEVYHQ
jgi:hypothetical protein